MLSLYISLPLICMTRTWNFQKLLSYMFYGGNVVRVLVHFFFTAAHFHLALVAASISHFVKGLNPGVISKVGWVWSLQDKTDYLNNVFSKNNYNTDFVRWNTHSNTESNTQTNVNPGPVTTATIPYIRSTSETIARICYGHMLWPYVLCYARICYGPVTTATIPYIRSTSETIARILQPYNIRVEHKLITTLWRLLTNVKEAN